MANTYYDSELTAEEIEEVLEAINGILTQANNGKVLAISNGKFEARSVQWGGGSTVLEPLSVTENGDYYPEAGVDGFDEVHVAVPSSSPTIQSLSATQNGTYTAPSGVDGYSPVVVNVSGGGGNGNTILHETEYQTSGSFSYSKEITIPKTSTYKITVQTYSNGFSLKINGVDQPYTINESSNYTYLYYAELSLNAGDIITMSCTSSGRSIATFVITDMNGSGGTTDEILYNCDFTLNTTGLTFWDGTNTGTSANSRMNIIDGWNIMQCTAEKVANGIKIVPKKAYAYLTCQIPPYWFNGKSITIKTTIDGIEYVSTGTFNASGASISVNTSFGQLYCYGYNSSDNVFTINFVNQIDREFVVSNASMKLAST